jgi:hypothetical protein
MFETMFAFMEREIEGFDNGMQRGLIPLPLNKKPSWGDRHIVKWELDRICPTPPHVRAALCPRLAINHIFLTPLCSCVICE